MRELTPEQAKLIERRVRAAAGKMPKRDLVELLRNVDTVQKRTGSDIPTTDDELHAWILINVGVDIPRVAVCPDHDPPFKFIADLFFDRVDSVLLMANRGGSKTFEVALLHYLNARFKPGIEGFSFGASEAQSQRCYAHLQKFVIALKDEEVSKSLQSETIWKNGAKVEIVAASIKAVNGPHPNIVHADEVELMDPAVFDESRNMAQSKNVRGTVYKAKDIITSSRKFASGAMQKLIDEIKSAVQKGRRPPYTLMQWCVFETAAPVENCQVARPELAACDHCDCHDIIKGTWDDGSERSLKDACQGKLYRSRGWVILPDIQKLFQQNNREMWEAQQECSRPSTAGLVVKKFRRENHCVRGYKPDPANGPIFEGIDFGGTNPHAVVFAQRLDVAVHATGYSGQRVTLPEGAFVFFDEIYEADISNSKLADRIVKREAAWRQVFPNFRITARHPDPQGKAARLELRTHNPPLPTQWLATRDVKEHIKSLNDLVGDNLFYIDCERCEMMLEEIDVWHYPKPMPGMVDDPDIPVNDFDHCMAASRYLIANVLRLKLHPRGGLGQSSSHSHTTATFVRDARQSLATFSRARDNGRFPGGDISRHYGP